MLLPAMFEIFTTVVLPVFLVAGVGFLLNRLRTVPPGPLSQVALYALTPALTFSALYRSQVSLQDSAQISALVMLLALANFVLSWSIVRLAHMERSLASAFYLSTMFMNSGNYGLPIALLAFGELGLQKALVFYIVQTVLAGTVAVYLAARSSAVGASALASVLQQPLPYAALLALFLRLFDISPPVAILRAAQLLGDTALPAMLLVLGIQLSTGWTIEEPPALGLAVVIRLVISAFLAIALAMLLAMDNLTQKVIIVQSSMPTAVFTIIVATEFGARPRFVTSAVVTSTLLSLATTTFVIFVVTHVLPS